MSIINKIKNFFFGWLNHFNTYRTNTSIAQRIAQPLITWSEQQKTDMAVINNHSAQQQAILKNINNGTYWGSFLIYAVRFIKNSIEYSYKAFAHAKKRKAEVDEQLKKQYKIELLQIANDIKNTQQYDNDEEKIDNVFEWLVTAQRGDLSDRQARLRNNISHTSRLLLQQKVEQLNNDYLPLMRNDFISFLLNVITGGVTAMLLKTNFSLITNLSSTTVALGFSIFAGATLLIDAIQAGYNYSKACKDYKHDKQTLRDKYITAQRAELGETVEDTAIIGYDDLGGKRKVSYRFEKQLLENKKTAQRHSMYSGAALAIIGTLFSILAIALPPLAPVFAGATLFFLVLKSMHTAYGEYASQKRDFKTMDAFKLDSLCPLGQEAYHNKFAPYKTDDLNAQFIQQQKKLTSQKIALMIATNVLFIIAAITATVIIAAVSAAPFVMPVAMLGIAVFTGLFSSITNKIMTNTHEKQINKLTSRNDTIDVEQKTNDQPIMAETNDQPIMAEANNHPAMVQANDQHITNNRNGFFANSPPWREIKVLNSPEKLLF